MFMAVKTITVTKEAYEALASDKNKDESFSEVILRTHKKKGNWEAVGKFIGAWKHVPDKIVEDMKKDIERMNRRSAKRLLERTKGI
jgi:predicted CopG family antitoxin